MSVPYDPSQAPMIAGNENRNLRILQSFGCLLGFNKNWHVACVSENCEDVLSVPTNQLLNASIDDVFPLNVVHQIRTRAQVLAHSHMATRVFSAELFEDTLLFDVSLHYTQDMYVLEIERKPRRAQMRDDVNLVRRLTQQLRSKSTLPEVARCAADSIKILTGSHLGAVYEVMPDGMLNLHTVAPEDGGFLKSILADGSLQDFAKSLHGSSAPFTRFVANWNEAGSRVIPTDVLTDLSSSVLAKLPKPYSVSVNLSAAVVSQIYVDGKIWGGVFGLSTSERHLDASMCSAIDLYVDFLGSEVARVEALRDAIPIASSEQADKSAASIDLEHVLVVEDDMLIALDLAHSLSMFGVEHIEIAHCEEDAIKYLETNTPDFVLLDVNLDKAQDTREIARLLSARSIPFALATGSARDSSLAQDYGNPPVLEKPVDPTALQVVLSGNTAA